MADTPSQSSQADYDKLRQENERLTAELASKAGTSAADEDLTPTPTQDELDRLRRGETVDGKAIYKTRQAKAG